MAESTPQQFPFIKNHAVSVQRKDDTQENERMLGQVFGGIPGGTLILGNFKNGSLKAGEAIIARMAIENEVLGFQTRIREVLEGSTKLYILEPPTQVEVINLRKSDRLQVFVPVNVHIRGIEKNENFRLIQGVIINLSRGGCSLTAKNSIDLNSDVNLHFSLPGVRQAYRIYGRVVRRKIKEQAYIHGVQFQRDTDNLSGLVDISHWINQNLAFTDA